MESLSSHFHNWFGVLFFVLLYSIALLFVPFYQKMNTKPRWAYVAFILAFAIEMHGIPFSMYLISWLIGRNLPEGILWGHTLFHTIGYLGMYINIGCAVIAFILILNGWYNIYKKYWSKETGTGSLVMSGVYRWIRHPQYTGLLLLSLGMLIEWVTLPMLIMFPIMAGMYVRLARKEEQDMRSEFGGAYKEYMKKTKMFIPFII